MSHQQPHHEKQGPAFNVPVLPHTAPEAEQPHGLMKLPLMPHQLRALNRCLVIEEDGSLLNQDFGHRFDYTSRGGCLADSVGTGKTATSIGLVLSGKEETEQQHGGTLVVAPAHLIPQWKHEITKFAGDSIQIIVGKEEYGRVCNEDLPSHCTRRIVLVAVDQVLNEEKVWYDWRRVYVSEKGHCINKRYTADQLALFRKAGNYCVKSPRGPCSYAGWVYGSPNGSLHMPTKPWRRVIFDEIQDLVAEGTVSQKNLLQLSRTAQHVWLLSATPFPHGNSSIYANHELLGFCRLRLNVNGSERLPADHVFERIKRQLYIRSPRHVADQAVTASQLVTRKTNYVPQLDLERRFYELERNSSPPGVDSFSTIYYPLREMTVHPEASEKLREQMSRHSHLSRPVSASGSVNQAAHRAVAVAKTRLRELQTQNLKRAQKQLRDATKSLELAEKVQANRARPVATSVFAADNSGTDVTRASREAEAKIVHDHYCACSGGLGTADCYADRKIFFRIMRDEDSTEAEFIRGHNATQEVVQYLDSLRDHLDQPRNRTLQYYITVSRRSVAMRKEYVENNEKEIRELKTRIQTLSQASKAGKVKNEDSDGLAATHGSKPAALVRFLQEVTSNDEQVIVFSYWHDTLKLIGQTLSRCGLKSVFCSGDGAAMSQALQQSTSNEAPILLLSAQSKASGANLQCATHVVLLDPAGSSADHGSTLEEQSVGRAVRMGQLQPVTVTRFCVTSTIEEELFNEIDKATACRTKQGAGDTKYVIDDFDSKAPAAENSKPRVSQEEDDDDDDDDDIAITETLTQDERLRQNFQKAQENGNVVSLDLDDEDSDQKKQASPSVKTPFLAQQPHEVKTPAATINPEPVTAGKRTGEEADREAKRMRSEQEEDIETTAVDTTSNRSVTPAPPAGSVAASASSGSSDEGSSPDSDKENNYNSGFAAVQDLLDRLDLSEYAPKFQDSGFDSMDWLCRFAEDAVAMEQLASIVGLKPGHAVRFQFGLRKEASSKQHAANTATATSSTGAAAAPPSTSTTTDVWV